MLYHKRYVTATRGNRMRSNLWPSPVSLPQASLGSPLKEFLLMKRRSSCTGGGAAHAGQERWLFAGYIPHYSATECFVGDIAGEGTIGNCLLSAGTAEQLFRLALKATRFHRELNMLNRGCQNRGKQLCQNVHVESLSQYKSKNVANLKVVEGGVKGQVSIPGYLLLTFR